MITLQAVGTIASQVAGSPVQIACDADPDVWAGYVMFNGWIHLAPGVCYRLTHPRGGADELGEAALVLEHEATHIALDTADEGDVECSASENVWQVVRRLRAAAGLSEGYTSEVLASAAVLHSEMPAAYRAVC